MIRLAPRPSSESLQGRNPEARLLPARYGDLIGAMTAAGQLGSAGQVITPAGGVRLALFHD